MQEQQPTDQLSAYLDGELTDAEVSELEHRLARDPSLRAELDELRFAVDLMRTHGPVSAPPELYRSILAMTDNEPMPGGWWRWLQRPFGIPIQGVAVALVAGLVLVVSVPVATMTLNGSVDGEREVGAIWRDRAADTPKDDVEPLAAAPGKSASYSEPSKSAAKSEAKRSSTSKSAPAEKGSEETKGTDGIVSTGTADDSTGVGAVSKKAKRTTKEEAFQMYSGGSTYRVRVTPDELGSLMRLTDRYKGQLHRGNGNNPVTTAEDLPAGEHTFTVQLDDAQARNGFTQDLKRAFNGRFHENVGSGDFLTIDGTRVTIELVVPEGSGGTADPKSMKAILPVDDTENIDMMTPPKLRQGPSGTPAN